MQSLKPRIDNIKLRYGDDKEKVQRETSILYDEAGVDPTAGVASKRSSLVRFLSRVLSDTGDDSDSVGVVPDVVKRGE